MITMQEAREYFKYDPKTGLLYWKKSKSNRALIGSIAGYPEPNDYWQLRFNNKLYPAHRIIWLIVYECWPIHHIDHINGDKSDNRLENLREAGVSQNLANSRKRVDNTSGYKGVSYYNRDKNWRASISIYGKQKHLGYFDTAEEAHNSYCRASNLHYGEFSRTD
jgi:hypothetical protein